MCGGSLEVNSILDIDEETMVYSSAGFVGWSDFPKGLRVLLLDHDPDSAAQAKLKLEQMDYIVSLFSSERKALGAISNRIENFHVAIVQVNTINQQESFTFLETTRGLPTLMVCDDGCLSTMMKCIALGAVEILQKPLSEEKLRNIWQHVVYKAFNAGESALCKSLEPIRESMSTLFQLQPEMVLNSADVDGSPEIKTSLFVDGEKQQGGDSLYGDGLPSPSTPQLEQMIRNSDAGDSLDPSSYSNADNESEVTGKDTTDSTISSSSKKFVDNICNDSNVDIPREEELHISSDESMKLDHKESDIYSEPLEETAVNSTATNTLKDSNPRDRDSSDHEIKNSKKKFKVDWTTELHRRFVQAVEQLGIDQAIPSKILALMKVEGLTRHNIASHLQKYRMQKKNALPKEEDRRWLNHRDSFSKVYAQKPLVPMPPPRSNVAYPSIFPAWGQPNFHPPGSQFWGHNGFYPWHSTQGIWPWKSHANMLADAWGCPVFPPQDHYSAPRVPQYVPLNHILPNHGRGDRNLQEVQLREEVIDEVVKEAISKPWLPLPIGLRPPSTDSVLAELQRQGLGSIPPTL